MPDPYESNHDSFLDNYLNTLDLDLKICSIYCNINHIIDRTQT